MRRRIVLAHNVLVAAECVLLQYLITSNIITRPHVNEPSPDMGGLFRRWTISMREEVFPWQPYCVQWLVVLFPTVVCKGTTSDFGGWVGIQ